MDPAIRWLKASYIAGAIADGLVGVLMLIPSRMGETGYRYSMGLGASLMFGWTALLIWAYRKPVERKGVLLLTIFVIVGLLAAAFAAVAAGQFPIGRIVPSTVVCISLAGLFALSLWKARRAA